MTAEQVRYYDAASAARELNVSRRTLARWRREGGGPPYARIGGRRLAYAISDIDNWISANTHASRAQELSRKGSKSA
jgi:predicted DNA-binding transcriptional regulator AlpA